MKSEVRFEAPWATIVKVLTVITLALFLGDECVGVGSIAGIHAVRGRMLMVVTPLVLIGISLPFMFAGMCCAMTNC